MVLKGIERSGTTPKFRILHTHTCLLYSICWAKSALLLSLLLLLPLLKICFFLSGILSATDAISAAAATKHELKHTWKWKPIYRWIEWCEIALIRWPVCFVRAKMFTLSYSQSNWMMIFMMCDNTKINRN